VTSTTPMRKRKFIRLHCTAAVRLGHKPVAHGCLGQEVLRLRRVVLELAT
jgi:hypothetical protein